MLALGVCSLVTIGLVAAFVLVDNLLHPNRDIVRRRLTEEFRKEASSTIATLYKDSATKALDLGLADPLLSDADELRKVKAPQLSLWQRLEALLQEAKVSATPSRFLSIATVVAVAVAIAGFLLGGWLAAAPALGVGFAMPFLALQLRRNARRERLLQQLPNAFELMARVLRAGQSLPQALQAVAEAFDDPLAGEIAHCQQQQHFGLRPEIVFREMATRSGILELRIFVMAMTIQRQIGGNFADMLDRLAGMIRARLRLRQQIRTLTAEGRLQGWTLVVLPIIVFGAVYFVNRPYAQILLEHKWLMAATVGSMLVGIFWMRQIIRFED